MKLDQANISKLSFPDSVVTDMDVNLPNKEVKIYLSEAFVDDGSQSYNIENVVVLFSKFSGISSQEYKLDQFFAFTADDENYFLKDICEFNFSNRKAVLKGFSRKRGYWVEYTLVDTEVTVEYQEKP